MYGAMETFLLNAIGANDSYDKTIIEECNQFVERVDPQKRYLTSRRYITKAKFDTFDFYHLIHNISQGILSHLAL